MSLFICETFFVSSCVESITKNKIVYMHLCIHTRCPKKLCKTKHIIGKLQANAKSLQILIIVH